MADSGNPNQGVGANHLLWLGPLIAVPGLLSYFVFFSRWPAFRDTAWLNFAILAVALAISAMGLRRAVASGGWRLFAGIASTITSGGLGALLVAYVFFLSNGLPSVEGVTSKGEAPYIFAAEDLFQLIRQNSMRPKERTNSTLVFSNQHIFLRTYDRLYAIGTSSNVSNAFK